MSALLRMLQHRHLANLARLPGRVRGRDQSSLRALAPRAVRAAHRRRQDGRCFAYITSHAAAKGNRVIVLAHRQEIADQISVALDRDGRGARAHPAGPRDDRRPGAGRHGADRGAPPGGHPGAGAAGDRRGPPRRGRHLGQDRRRMAEREGSRRHRNARTARRRRPARCVRSPW